MSEIKHTEFSDRKHLGGGQSPNANTMPDVIYINEYDNPTIKTTDKVFNTEYVRTDIVQELVEALEAVYSHLLYKYSHSHHGIDDHEFNVLKPKIIDALNKYKGADSDK